MQPLTLRVTQLEQSCPLLSQDELLHKAQALESATENKRYFAKKEYPEFDAAVFKPNSEFFYSKIPKILNKSGTSKSVKGFLQVPVDLKKRCDFVARSVNRWDKNRDSSFTLKAYTVCVHEVSIARQLVGKEGIAQLLFSEDISHEANRPKICAFWKIYEGDLTEIKVVSYLEKQQIAKELITGLWNMHVRGIVHGDLKPNNALYFTVDSKKHAVWADFGNSFQGQAPPSWSSFWVARYGSALSTAPEVWAELPFRGDYFKADIFALGTTLFQLHTGKFPPWAQKTYEYRKNRCTSGQLREHLIESLASFSSHKDPYLNLICKMLAIDPEERIDIFQCRELISEIEL